MKKQIAMIAMMASLVTTTAFAEGVKIDAASRAPKPKPSSHRIAAWWTITL